MQPGSVEERDAVILNELKFYGVKLPKPKKLKPTHAEQERCNFEINPNHSFGVRLSEQEWILEDNKYVPRFLALSSNYLYQYRHSEGLFRKTGSVVRQKKLRIHVEKGGTLEGSQPDDVASILKQWLRELPEPVIPLHLQEIFIRCHQLESASSRAITILLACLLLPPEHLHTLCYLLHFLKIIASESLTNKMDAHNLAVIIAPSLLPCSFGERRDKTGLCVLPQRRGTSALQGWEPSNDIVQHQAGLVQTLIENASMVGEVPLEVTERLNIQDLAVQFTDEIGRCDVDATEAGHVKCRKKRRSGTVQELMSGIKKFVVRSSVPVSKECCPSVCNKENDSNDKQRAPVTRSSSKRKADGDVPPFYHSKKQAVEEQQHVIPDPLPLAGDYSRTYDFDICSPNPRVNTKPRRKSLGILKRQRKRSHTPSKNLLSLSEKKCRNVLKPRNSNITYQNVQVTKRTDASNIEIIEKVNSLAISSPENILTRKRCRAAKKTDSFRGRDSGGKSVLIRELSNLSQTSPSENYDGSEVKVRVQTISLQKSNHPQSGSKDSRPTEINDNSSSSYVFPSTNSVCLSHNSGIGVPSPSSKNSLTITNAETSQVDSQLRKNCQSKSRRDISSTCIQVAPKTKLLLLEESPKVKSSHYQVPIVCSSLETKSGESCQLTCHVTKRTPDKSFTETPTVKHSSSTFSEKKDCNKSYTGKLRSDSTVSPSVNSLSNTTPAKLLKRNSSNKASLRRGRPNTIHSGLPSGFRVKHSSDPTVSNMSEFAPTSLQKTNSDGALFVDKSDDDCVVKTLNFSDVFHPDEKCPLSEVINTNESVGKEVNCSAILMKQSPHIVEDAYSETEKFNDSGLGKSTEDVLNSSSASQKSTSINKKQLNASAKTISTTGDLNFICLKSESFIELSSTEGKAFETECKSEEFSLNTFQEVSDVNCLDETTSLLCCSETVETTLAKSQPNAEINTSESSHLKTTQNIAKAESVDNVDRTPLLKNNVPDSENWISAEKFLRNLEPSLKDDSFCQRESVIKLRNKNVGMVHANVQKYNSILSSPSQLPRRISKRNPIPVRVPSIFDRSSSASLKEGRHDDSNRKSGRRRSSSFGSKDDHFLKPSPLVFNKKKLFRKEKCLDPLTSVVESGTPPSCSVSHIT